MTAREAASSLVYDLRFALRGLRHDRAFSLAAILTLALALALNVVAFTIMDAMLFRGLPLARRSDRLVYLGMLKPSGLQHFPGPLLYSDFQAWRSQTQAFEGLAFAGQGGPILLRDNEGRSFDMDVQRVSANAFALLGIRPMLGRDFVAADEAPGAAPVALLDYRFWASRFDKRADIVGATVHINGTPTTVIGVMPEGFVFVYEQNLWMPLADTPALHRKGFEGTAFARLRDGATLPEARAELDTINRRLEAADPATPRGVPSVLTYSQNYLTPDAPTIYGSLWAGSWFVLLIACANLTNLTLVRTMARWREFSIRVALGAGLGRMVRQIVAESLMLAGAAGALAWWITNWSMRAWAVATASRYLALDYRVDSATLAYLVTISVVAAILFSLAPVARVLHLSLSGALTGEARGVTQSLRGKRLAAGLVVGQMTLAIVLLSGAGVLVRSFEKIVGADTGVHDPEHVLVGFTRLPSDKYPSAAARLQYFDRLAARVRTIQGIEGESVSSTFPSRTTRPRRFEIEGRPDAPDGGDYAQFLTAGSDYFRVMGTAAISGRDFNDGDRAAAPPVAVVNQSFAATFWPGDEPLGKHIRLTDGNTAGEWRTVVGVVPNIMQGDATRQSFKPVVYVPFRQQPSAGAFFFARTSVPPTQVARAVRAEVQKLDPSVIVEDFATLKSRFAFDRDYMDFDHSELGKHALVAPVFAAIALLLAAIGLTAVIAHSVTQRTKEIGVRMAIGAAALDISRMILREGMSPVVIGMMLGLAASLAVNRILQSQLIGVTPYDPVTMAGASALLILVALAACQIPARRAMRVDPVVALRHE
jgi:putative ABC transport system permease protein